MREAGIVSRGLALTLDLCLIGVTCLFVFLLIEYAGHALAFRAGLLNRLVEVVAPVAPFLLALGYHVSFWMLLGATPGKMLLGLRVETIDGRPLGLTRAVVRYLAYSISALPLLLGFLWVIRDPRRQAWHDKIARTRVVYVEASAANRVKVRAMSTRQAARQ